MGDDVFGTSAYLPTLIIGSIVSHAYLAVVLMLLARSTRTPSAGLAWLPIGNLVLITKIAGKPPSFLLLLLIPLVNLWAGIAVWMCVAERIGRPASHAFLLLVPAVGPLVPLWWALTARAAPAPTAAPAACADQVAFCSECGSPFECREAYCGECGAHRPVAADRSSGSGGKRTGLAPAIGGATIMIALGVGAWRLLTPAVDAVNALRSSAASLSGPSHSAADQSSILTTSRPSGGLPRSSSAVRWPYGAPRSNGRGGPTGSRSAVPSAQSDSSPHGSSSGPDTSRRVMPRHETAPPPTSGGSFSSREAVVVRVDGGMSQSEAEAQVHFLTAVSDAEKGRWSEAEAALARAVELQPSSGKYRAEHAATLLRSNRRDEAVREAEEALHLGFREHWVLRELGMTP